MTRKRIQRFLPRGLSQIDWKKPLSLREVLLGLVPVVGLLGLVVGVAVRSWPVALAGAAVMLIGELVGGRDPEDPDGGPISRRLEQTSSGVARSGDEADGE